MGDCVTLNASCHCRGFDETFTLPRSACPLKSSLCSCTSCRHVTGQLFGSYAVIPLPERPSGGSLVQYARSPNLIVNFCKVCGAIVANFRQNEWEFATGILSVVRGAAGDERREGKGKGLEGLLDRQCLFVGDTADGGGIVWLPDLNSAGNQMKRYIGDRTTEIADVEAMQKSFSSSIAQRQPQDLNDQDERLYGSCHCRSVQFYLTHPKPTGEPKEDGKKGKWWLAEPNNPNDRHLLALLDACDSCRLVTGVEINFWTYVPSCDVSSVEADGSVRPFDFHDEKLNISRYASSKGNWRSFCRTCGAPICYWGESRQIEIIDFGVGLFHGNGARCEDWVKWGGIEHVGDAMDREMIMEIEARAGKGGHA